MLQFQAFGYGEAKSTSGKGKMGRSGGGSGSYSDCIRHFPTLRPWVGGNKVQERCMFCGRLWTWWRTGDFWFVDAAVESKEDSADLFKE